MTQFLPGGGWPAVPYFCFDRIVVNVNPAKSLSFFKKKETTLAYILHKALIECVPANPINGPTVIVIEFFHWPRRPPATATTRVKMERGVKVPEHGIYNPKWIFDNILKPLQNRYIFRSEEVASTIINHRWADANNKPHLEIKIFGQREFNRDRIPAAV